MVIDLRHNMSQQSGLPNSRLTNNCDWDFLSHPLHNKADLEEIVKVDNISRLTLYSIVIIPWNIRYNGAHDLIEFLRILLLLEFP